MKKTNDNITYIVKNGDYYERFLRASDALRYAERIHSKEVFLEDPTQTDWYYWDWDKRCWIYP